MTVAVITPKHVVELSQDFTDSISLLPPAIPKGNNQGNNDYVPSPHHGRSPAAGNAKVGSSLSSPNIGLIYGSFNWRPQNYNPDQPLNKIDPKLHQLSPYQG